MKIKKIFHIADIHCRNFKRHKEYRAVFKRLFKYLKANVDDESIIYLAGDIVHSKNDMSPELISIVSDFLKGCADIAPTIMITGNHDTNLNNDARMDALSPIVDALNHPNLHYWKYTGVYELGNLTFSVFSVYGDARDWVLADAIDADFKIALHHGAVSSAVTDLNWNIENEYVTPKIFEGFDLTLLGDIHKRQFLDANKTVAYAGSLIQQNHGEDLDHGILVWNVLRKSAKYVPIQNDIAYATIEVDNGKVITPKSYVSSLPKNLRLRIKYSNCAYKDVQKIVQLLKTKHKLLETTIMKVNDYEYNRNDSKTVLGDVRDVEYQNKLITSWIEDGEESEFVNVDAVRHVNRVMNSRLRTDQVLVRNVIWKPEKFTFSNMFSYGPSNSIDFTNYNGIQGIFAPNASGKSTLLDAMTFCLFDKCSRTWKAKDVLNNRKNRFKCRLEFELNNETYAIEREGIKHPKTGNVKVNVDFGKITENGYISLNGHDRDQTNRIIRGYIGTYDDFLLTALSTQNDNKNFIFKSQRERKDLLNSFLDISIFEELYLEAKSEIKDKQVTVRNLEIDLNNPQYDGLGEQINKTQQSFLLASGSYIDADRATHEYNSEIKKLTQQIQFIEEPIDIVAVNSKLESVIQSIEGETEELKHLEEQFENHKMAYDDAQNTWSQIDVSTMMSKEMMITECNKQLTEISGPIQVMGKEIEYIEEQIRHLETHEYDPNCEYCIRNSFVIKAKEAKEKLPEMEKEYQKLLKQKGKWESELEEATKIAIPLRKKHDACQYTLVESDRNMKAVSARMESLRQSITRLRENKLDLDKMVQRYENQEKTQINNEELKEKINSLNKLYEQSSIKTKQFHSDLMKLNSELVTLKTKYESWQEKQHKLQELYDEVSIYEAYIRAISKNGVPYMLLKKVIPVIQDEVNQILNQIVDFYVTLETDDKNINCYIHYNDEVSWPVELASGMERFMISVATRAALINVSSLPRPNFLAIDEGFGVLDSDKLASVDLLFDFLRTQFDFILCISHLDAMKDLADALIPISKSSSGFSEIKLA